MVVAGVGAPRYEAGAQRPTCTRARATGAARATRTVCPAGPVLVQRFAFRDVHSLTLGFGPGQRVRIEWSRARAHKNPAKQLTFSVLPLHVAEIVGTIHRLYAAAATPSRRRADARVIREKATAAAAAAAAARRATARPRLPPPRAQLLNAETETVRLYLLIEVVNLATGRLLPRAAVVSSSTPTFSLRARSISWCDRPRRAARAAVASAPRHPPCRRWNR